MYKNVEHGTFENYSFRQDIGCNNEALPGVLGNRGKRTLI